MRRTSFNAGWEVRPKANRMDEFSGEAPRWAPVTLPHDAMIGTERSPAASGANAYFPGGVWEYQKRFELSPDAASAAVLEFEGVYRDAVVVVNGAVAAQRPYGYSNFFVPIDHLLRADGENEIRVEARANNDSRWYSGAGIYRNVWLLDGGLVHLVPDGLQVRTPEVDDAGATVAVTTEVDNRSGSRANLIIRAEVVDANGDVVADEKAPLTMESGETLTARLRLFVADAKRWDLDDPTLYICRVRLLTNDETVDQESTTFGIRSLAVDPRNGLRINGSPVLLRGACVHHDNGPIGAATIDRAEERRVEILKAAGFNAIRSAHNPMSKAMLDACDRIGMVVMDETFDMWTSSKTNDDYSLRFPDWWEADTEAMVRKDFNHPSVVFYSIGNEVPDTASPSGVRCGRDLAEKVRDLDDTRFVTEAVTGFFSAGPALFDELRDNADAMGPVTNLQDMFSKLMVSPLVAEKTAETFSYLDVSGYNYMESRFEMDRELYPQRVIVATETHPSIADVCWAGVTDNPNVIGDFTWTGWDYLGEAGIASVEYGHDRPPMGMQYFVAPYPWLTAWCGDIDITGERRPQSHYREIVWGLRTDPHIAVLRPEHHGKIVVHGSSWSWGDVVSSWSWAGHEGEPVTVEVYAAADEVELLVNDRSLGRQPVGAKHGYRAAFEALYEPGEIVAVAYSDGRETGRTALRSASDPMKLDVRADREQINADRGDLAYVAIALADAHGNVFVTADREVTVELDGPGTLQGLASADPKSDESFVDSTQTTFNGRALAVVRPTGVGTLTIRVSAEGCATQEVRVDTLP